jgi:hypothetical protein
MTGATASLATATTISPALVWMAVTVVLATVLMVWAWRSRWVTQRPLARYGLVSLYAHLILAVYASSVSWLPPAPVRTPQRIRIELVPGPELAEATRGGSEQAFLEFPNDDQHPSPTGATETLPADDPAGRALSDAGHDFSAAPLAAQPSHDPMSTENSSDSSSSKALTAEQSLSERALAEPLSQNSTENSSQIASLPASTAPHSTEDFVQSTAIDATHASQEHAPLRGDQPAGKVGDGASDVDVLSDAKLTEQKHETSDQLPKEPPHEVPHDVAHEVRPPVTQTAGVDAASSQPAENLKQATGTQQSTESPGELPATQFAEQDIVPDRSGHSFAPGRSVKAGRGAVRPADGQPVPAFYQLRFAEDRTRIVELLGGSGETERAVARGLEWLARNQGSDGRWVARLHGAGQERHVMGQDRQGTGADADTGVTGLAILAFLGAGHTHWEGTYRQTVQRGLEFLLSQQTADGNLAGQAGTFAAMYCHGIALLAIAESYALTGDQRLRPALELGQRFTLNAQSPYDGGWRYRPRDAQGDTSQFGWQVMALKSAELCGLPIPPGNRVAMENFLQSVSLGRAGGLAAYRAGMAASRPMTAEATLCRLLLWSQVPSEQLDEAVAFLRQSSPAERPVNLYYWYYGTLALYLSRHPYWPEWNREVSQQLLALQIDTGPNRGSWPTDTVWGGYGGRVYTTALATLCLETYYRFDREALGQPARPVWEAERPRGLLSR